MLNFSGGSSSWSCGQNQQYGGPEIGSISGLRIASAIMPAVPYLEPVRVWRSGATIAVELNLPTDRPNFILRCRIDTTSQALADLRRHIYRVANHRDSAWAIAGMVLLLALCGWIAGGADGARRAVAEGIRQSDDAAISRDAMFRWFGARPLRPAEIPRLFHILAEVCRRARLSRLPELYYVAAPTAMNAYACGGPNHSAIIVTEGLLRGMSAEEITSILAHEVAHIRNRDAWAMNSAQVLNRAIEWTALAGLASLQMQRDGTGRPLANLLSAAPALGRLLFLALSRIRELDADATALELTGDTHAMVAALRKMEQHHSRAPKAAVAAFDDDAMRFLRTHPATSQRVDTLLGLAS